MKRIVSISLGSSNRNYIHKINIMGQDYHIERIGSDGSFSDAIKLIKELDGKIDAFGIGGIDLFLKTNKKTYRLREAVQLTKAAQKTPMYDGSRYKDSIERRVIYKLKEKGTINFKDKKVLVTSALDRFGMAEALERCGGNLIIGDLLFALNINIPIYSLSTLDKVAKIMLPIASRLPFKMLYPIGEDQNININRFNNYYSRADIIAGDFHYIKRYMPIELYNKTIITNTVTREDVNELKTRGVKLLITTTPKLGERSFGTNVMEALIETIIKDKKGNNKIISYEDIYKLASLEHRVEYLN